ncbi:MAG: HEPN domain-containing protein [Candidatus Sumerlaeota bacterium]|nr:HEPN domain-containing protein [Candidatus Sumerlaeota bacterium]
MRVAPVHSRCVGLLLIVVLSSFVVGCGKWRTQYSLSSAKKLKVRIQEYMVESYPDLAPRYKKMNDLMVQAQDSMDKKDYVTSVPKAKQAVEEGTLLLNETRVQHSKTLRQRARDDMAVVRANDGQKLDATKYQEIDLKLQELEKKFDETKHDDVIALSNQIFDKTKELIEQMRKDAEAGSRDVVTKLDDMTREKVPEYAKTYIGDVQKMLEDIKQLITPGRRYKEALAQIEAAKQRAALGIKEALKARSAEKLKAVEGRLNDAHALGAGKAYAIEAEQKCKDTFGKLDDKHKIEQYQAVLDAVDPLAQAVDQLIIQTKRECAEDYIGQVTKIVVDLVDGSAKEYAELKGLVEDLEKKQGEAKAEYEKSGYDNAKHICEGAIELGKDIKGRFDQLAAGFIQQGKSALAEAKSIFDKAVEQNFFIIKPDTVVPPEDMPFEQSKKTLFDHLKASLGNIANNLELAQTRRSEEKYHNAIVISKSAVKDSAEDTNQVYHVGSHNAMVEVANSALHFYQDAGKDLAPREMETVTKLIAETRDTIKSGEYRKGFDKAADARAALDNAVTAMHKNLDDQLAEAKKAMEKAAKAGVFLANPKKAEEVQSLMDQATGSVGASVAIGQPTNVVKPGSPAPVKAPAPKPEAPVKPSAPSNPPVPINPPAPASSSLAPAKKTAPASIAVASQAPAAPKAAPAAPAAPAKPTAPKLNPTETLLALVTKPASASTPAAPSTPADVANPPTPLETNQIKYAPAKDAVEKTRIMIEAMTLEKSRQDADAAIAKAESMLQKALAAGANAYAAQEISDAQARFAQAVNLSREKDFVDARIAAEGVWQVAFDALYKYLREADDAIATARMYRGWDFKNEDVTQAIIWAQNARDALENGKYEDSAFLARQAVNLSKKITQFSRERDFRIRTAELKKIINMSLRTGAGFFQPKELREMIEELYKLDENFTVAKYDDYSARLAKLQGRVDTTVNSTPQAMQKLLVQWRNYLEELERLGAMKRMPYDLKMARWILEQADMDFRHNRYAKSYESLLKGIRIANTIADDLSDETFKGEASDMVKEISNALFAFRGLLEYNPNQLIPLLTGFNARGRLIAMTGMRPNIVYMWENGSRQVLSRTESYDASQFSERVTELYTKALTLRPPATLKHIHRKMIETLQDAAMAGQSFQKFLFIDEFSPKQQQEIIRAAYDYADKTRTGVGYLRDNLLKPEERRRDIYPKSLDRFLPIP